MTEGLSLLRCPHVLREYWCAVLMGFCGGASDVFPLLHQLSELVMAQAVQELSGNISAMNSASCVMVGTPGGTGVTP